MERVLISGGQGDLAQAIARAFCQTGAEVLAPGRELLDVADPASVDSYFSGLEALDLFIANAGLADDCLLARCREADWDRQLEVNLHGAFRCARAAIPPMLRRRCGHLIFISSHSALHPPAGQAAYAAAKAGLIGMGKSLARELGAENIRVNLILPGFLETKMTQHISPARREAVQRAHSLARFNSEEAVASFLVHLHRQLPHTSGQVFQLDSRIG